MPARDPKRRAQIKEQRERMNKRSGGNVDRTLLERFAGFPWTVAPGKKEEKK